MEKETLIQMANQIAAFWSAYPKNEALESISRHIHSSWEPRMRDQLKTLVESGGSGLSPLFLEAMQGYFKGPKGPAPTSGPAGTAKPKASSPAS